MENTTPPKASIELPEKPTLPPVRKGAPVLDLEKPTVVPSGIRPEQMALILQKNDTGLTGATYAVSLLNTAFGMMWDFYISDQLNLKDGRLFIKYRLSISDSRMAQPLIARELALLVPASDINLDQARHQALTELVRGLGADV